MSDVAIKTAWGVHPLLAVTFPGKEEQQFCGNSWCTGECGFPALVIPETGNGDTRVPEMKMYSDMVAMGRVMQRWRVEWKGEKVLVPEEHREALEKKWWR